MIYKDGRGIVREVEPEDVPAVLESINEFEAACDALLAIIDGESMDCFSQETIDLQRKTINRMKSNAEKEICNRL